MLHGNFLNRMLLVVVLGILCLFMLLYIGKPSSPQPFQSLKPMVNIYNFSPPTLNQPGSAPYWDQLDKSRKETFSPWNDGNGTFRENCQKFEVRYLKKHSAPLHILASFPASGNTWTRFLMEGLSGIFTGSIYQDKLLKKNFLGGKEPWNDGSLFAVKAHLPPNALVQDFSKKNPKKPKLDIYKGIILIRNPFLAMPSYYQWYVLKSHKGNIDLKKYDSEAYFKFVQKNVKIWKTMIKTWADYSVASAPVLVINYEDLLNNLEEELMIMAKFMQIEVNMERIQCLLDYSEGHYHRGARKQKKVKKPPLPFPKDFFQEMIHDICEGNEILKSQNLKSLPLTIYYEDLKKKYTLTREQDAALKNLCVS